MEALLRLLVFAASDGSGPTRLSPGPLGRALAVAQSGLARPGPHEGPLHTLAEIEVRSTLFDGTRAVAVESALAGMVADGALSQTAEQGLVLTAETWASAAREWLGLDARVRARLRDCALRWLRLCCLP